MGFLWHLSYVVISNAAATFWTNNIFQWKLNVHTPVNRVIPSIPIQSMSIVFWAILISVIYQQRIQTLGICLKTTQLPVWSFTSGVRQCLSRCERKIFHETKDLLLLKVVEWDCLFPCRIKFIRLCLIYLLREKARCVGPGLKSYMVILKPFWWFQKVPLNLQIAFSLILPLFSV